MNIINNKLLSVYLESPIEQLMSCSMDKINSINEHTPHKLEIKNKDVVVLESFKSTNDNIEIYLIQQFDEFHIILINNKDLFKISRFDYELYIKKGKNGKLFICDDSDIILTKSSIVEACEFFKTTIKNYE